MQKCIGICSKCGRCKNAALMSGANDRKTKLTAYPTDFQPDTGMSGYGMAFDIGTTTVVGMLWDLNSGKMLDTVAKTNPQNEFGMDVISRITFCGRDEEKLKILQGKIRECLNQIIEELCKKQGINSEDILKVSICGNTTMSHLFLGYCPISLALAPFEPAYKGTIIIGKEESGLEVSESCQVTVIPNIAGHVGGDITAGILASRLEKKKDLTVFIDIGTNGEIALVDGNQRFVCSTAAGPAFEGASISCGMRAAAGAIEKVLIDDGEVYFKTIGECEAVGICGSGILDCVAELLKAGIVNHKGKMLAADDLTAASLPETLRERLVTDGKMKKFILAYKEDGTNIAITQNDIREIQLAKGAMAAGIAILLEEAGRSAEEIEEFIVAGAFGSYISKESAVAIGLLPDIDIEKITSGGNTAGAGVSMAMMSDVEMQHVKTIPQAFKHVELADKADFQDVYLKTMLFPQK